MDTMAEDNVELQRRLQELDEELEDGDITRKGYEKRRTAILSEYLCRSSWATCAERAAIWEVSASTLHRRALAVRARGARGGMRRRTAMAASRPDLGRASTMP